MVEKQTTEEWQKNFDAEVENGLINQGALLHFLVKFGRFIHIQEVKRLPPGSIYIEISSDVKQRLKELLT